MSPEKIAIVVALILSIGNALLMFGQQFEPECVLFWLDHRLPRGARSRTLPQHPSAWNLHLFKGVFTSIGEITSATYYAGGSLMLTATEASQICPRSCTWKAQ